jgi:hypothetical protein
MWNTKIELTIDDILKGQGADPKKIVLRKPALLRVAESALELGNDLIEPRVVTRVFCREELIFHHAVLRELAEKNLNLLAEKLPKAVSYVMAICTIGDGLENLSTQFMSSDIALAIALDGMANAAIDRLVECVFHDLADEAESEGLGVSLPVSPGSHTWPLEIGQPLIFGALNPDPQLVRLTDHFLMLPRKSSSFILGVGPQVKRHGKTCDYCGMVEACRYRIRKTF